MSEKKSWFSLWAQVDPTGPFQFLTCVGITGNVAIPEGDVTITYCPGLMSGEFEPDLLIDGEPGPATLTLEQPYEKVYNWTLELRCPINLQLNYVCGAASTTLQAYEIATVLIRAKRTSGEIIDPAALEPGDDARVMTSATFAAILAAQLKQLDGVRQSPQSTQGVNDIEFLPEVCFSGCSAYTGLGLNGYAVLDSDYLGAYGDTVLHTINGGGLWSPTTTTPFTALGRNAMAVKVLWMGGGAHRVIVAGGTMPATWPEIAYSDDAGVVWHNVNPATGASYGGAGITQMCWDHLGRLWAVGTGGRIYVSSNQGQSWSVSYAAVGTSQNFNDVVFYNANVGYVVANSNEVLRTTDGGATWALLVGPFAGQNLHTCCVNRYGHLFVGTNAGTIWRSTNADQDLDWGLIDTFGGGAGSVNRLRADPRYRFFIGAIWDSATPLGTLYRSEDGGVSFNEQDDLNDLGLNALCVCDQNTIFVGGEAVLGTSFIGRYIREV